MTKLVFGTGGRFGRLSPHLASRLVDFAISQGIYSFDTGCNYSNGKSQLLLSQCLSPYLLSSSHKISISSKVAASNVPGKIISDITRIYSLFQGLPIDCLFLWGPTIEDLSCDSVWRQLNYAKSLGLVKRIGINTHDLDVMQFICSSFVSGLIDDVMIDYNLLLTDREPFFPEFKKSDISIWAGTVLAQGFLVLSVFEMFLRTRSISYLARSFFNPPTAAMLRQCMKVRSFLRSSYFTSASRIPLSFVASNPYVDYIPMGMLSQSSMLRNLDIEKSLVPSRILSFVAARLRGF